MFYKKRVFWYINRDGHKEVQYEIRRGETGMVCKECGAKLMDTDQFCPKCGTRVIKEMRCPDCGAVLREGTKFCHKCGRLVESGSRQKAVEETEEIPIDAIEQNILSETAAEIKAGRGGDREPRRTAPAEGRPERSSVPRSAPARSTSPGNKAEHTPSSKGAAPKKAAEHAASSKSSSARSTSERTSAAKSTPSKSTSGRSTSGKSVSGHSSASGKAAPGRRSAEPPSGRRTSIPEPPRRKRMNYREDDWEEEDWEDEEDWDEDDWDDEEGVDIITIMTVVVGCVLLIVVAFLGYRLYKQHAPKDYEKGAEVQQDEAAADEDDGEQKEPQETDGTGEQSVTDGDGSGTYMITVIHNVNVRDQPSTTGTNILTVAQEGDVFTCYGTTEDGQWYEIRLEDGTPGFVFHEYISVDESSSVDVNYVEEQYIQE